MNSIPTTSLTPRPRLACRIARLWCSVANDRPSRHVAACPDCQAFLAANAALERELRSDAVRASAELHPSDAFAQSIIRAVRTTERPSRPSGMRAGSWLLGGLGIAAAAAVAVGLMAPRAILPGSGTPVASANPSEDAAAIAQTVESLSVQFVDTVIPSAGELVAENPLQRELSSMYSDVRSALDFLAMNFSPTAPKPRAPQGGQI